MDFELRRGRVRKLLDTAGAEALLITNFANVTYLTGFTGDDSYLLVARDKEILITDPRYTTQLEAECPGLELHVRQPGGSMPAAAVKTIKGSNVARLAIEGDSMCVSLLERLAKDLPKVAIQSISGLVESLREVKDKQEIAELRQAIAVAERAFAAIRPTLRPADTERQIANDLDWQMRDLGAKGSSFETIVAVGARAALPHARPTDIAVGENELILIDWGAHGRLYRSDLTRVLTTARISPKLKRVYGVVLQAQSAAIAAIRPGVKGSEVDAVARNVIKDAGFGRRFGHSLGHGIGLDIHEGPRLAKTNPKPLKAGMVVTVEPGIYVPGWGGIRIE
jgi:Xaa-Pro aminopeptidase